MLKKFIHCESCGMPMISDNDYGGSDIKNKWCRFCSNLDGSHKTYEEILNRFTKFIYSKEAEMMSGEKYDSLEEAKCAAKNYLSKMPAWKEN